MKRKSTFVPLFLIACVLASWPLKAQEIRVTAEVDSFTYRIGDYIKTRLHIDAAPNVHVTLPHDTSHFTGAEFVYAEPEKQTLENGRLRFEQTYILTTFDTGQVVLTINVPYRLGDDTTVSIASSQPIYLHVSMPDVDTTAAYRDIKDVMHVNLTVWDYLLYLAILLAAAAAGWYAYRRWKKLREERKVEMEPVKAEPRKPSHVVALERLHDLEAEGLLARGLHKEYQSELTDILREYIERKFGIPALEETTAEVIPAMISYGIEPVLVRSMQATLECADRTKFARYIPTTMEHDQALRFAYEFVDRTQAYPDPEEEPAIASAEEPSDEAKQEAGTEEEAADV
jgi:hypothetical protein